MKHLPNIITTGRIIFCIILIFTYKNQYLFPIVYIACGLSDFLDGYIACKTNTQSLIGARLDSFADLAMFGTIIPIILIFWGNELKNFLPWIIVVLLIRIAGVIIAAYKYHSIVFLHTYGNKLTGALIFMVPLILIAFNNVNFLWPICIVSLLAAIEECLIHITADKFDLNRKGLFKL